MNRSDLGSELELAELLGRRDVCRYLLQVRRYPDGQLGHVLALVQPDDTVWTVEDIPAPVVNALAM